MKKFLTLFATIAIIATPYSTALASQENTETTILKQLDAITAYIERTFTLPAEQTSSESMQMSIEAGIKWLQTAQEENGHFAYEYAPYIGTYMDGEQMVRQAGALYALTEVERRQTAPDAALAVSVERAIDYFEDISKEGTYDGETFRCIADSKSSIRCQLGATSLALTGLIGHLTVYPEKRAAYESLLHDWISFIRISQKENGGFRNVFRIGNSFQSEAESAFSNGEALLALVRAHIYDSETVERALIDQAFSYLKDEPFDTALYLWIMAALKELEAHEPNPAYVSYAEEFTSWRLEHTRRLRHTTKNYCAYAEGIASAYSILENTLSEIAKNELRGEIAFWNAKNLRHQITTRDYYRVVLKEGNPVIQHLPDPERALGGFLTSEEVVTERIDFTQHCITALVQTLVDIEGHSI